MGSQTATAQFFEENIYYEGELSGIASFLMEDENGDVQFLTLGGLGLKGGVGIHNDEGSLFLGVHSGVEGNFRHRTGIIPVYVNSRVAFDVSENGKIILGFGYGRSMQIGTERYAGYLRKYSIAHAIGDENMFSYFVEVANHGFRYPDGVRATTVNLGIALTFL